MNYYTYAYLRQDGTPYYIGKGTGDRINHPNHTVGLPETGRRVFLKRNLSEAEAYKHEEYLISVLGRKDIGTGILWNRTNGGETPGEGYVWSDDQKQARSDAYMGANNPNWKGGIRKDPDYQKNYIAANKEKIAEYKRQWRAKRRAAGLPVV